MGNSGNHCMKPKWTEQFEGEYVDKYSISNTDSQQHNGHCQGQVISVDVYSKREMQLSC